MADIKKNRTNNLLAFIQKNDEGEETYSYTNIYTYDEKMGFPLTKKVHNRDELTTFKYIKK